MKKLSLFLTLSLILSGIPITTASAAYKCTDYRIIFARGSGQSLDGPDYQAFSDAFAKDLEDDAIFYELGTSPQGGYQYPAVSASKLTTLLGSRITLGKAGTYGKSVKQGVGELKAYVKKVSTACPDTQFILGGYSQGAQVISTALPDLDPEKILYAATFGDPKLYLPEGKRLSSALLPQACYNLGLSNYRVAVPDCQVHQGILTGTIPYQKSGYTDKLGAWCNIGDVICGSYLVSDYTKILDGHHEYSTDGSYAYAARKAEMAARIADGETVYHDLAILIDTTASMSKYLNKYKKQALDLAKKTIEKGGRVALFEFRDVEDFPTRMVNDFDDSLEEIQEGINSLDTYGGGDDEESALSAALTALNNLDWLKGATKSLTILTDAGYHSPDKDGTTLAEVVKRAWEIDPVNFYVITTEEDAYKELAEATGGRTFNLKTELALSTETLLAKPEEELVPPYLYTGEQEDATISVAEQNLEDDVLKVKLNKTAGVGKILVTADDELIGFTEDQELEFADFSQISTLTFTPYANNGVRGESITLSLAATPTEAPGEGSIQPTKSVVEMITDEVKKYHVTPKAPNTGSGPRRR